MLHVVQDVMYGNEYIIFERLSLVLRFLEELIHNIPYVYEAGMCPRTDFVCQISLDKRMSYPLLQYRNC